MAERKSLFSTKTLSQAESIMSDLINVKSNHNKVHTVSKKKNNISELSVTCVNNSNKPVIKSEKISTISNIKISSKYVKKHINLTFRVDLINKIKVYAKERNLSVSELLEQFIQQL
ncbi:DUF6364 family protein [Spiroplasma endosymbiont of Danaus chrysippus]|uniref:DUF6364 family protein n=1 Tax=Spiroplasma endosymbiont of Danaus chrysippus TaxID=2691041 RepID=UPI0013C57313|nr:DUF6364 family protein [Spiroplasma endosymbiont of Danaus chrysippus]CAB1054892.1 hypothetical protein [Spiroplasma endosymbiont of Danaus chrysippus]